MVAVSLKKTQTEKGRRVGRQTQTDSLVGAFDVWKGTEGDGWAGDNGKKKDGDKA